MTPLFELQWDADECPNKISASAIANNSIYPVHTYLHSAAVEIIKLPGPITMRKCRRKGNKQNFNHDTSH